MRMKAGRRMGTRHVRAGRLAVLGVALPLWGCASSNGIVEIDSGLPVAVPGVLSSEPPVYAVHVGERPTIRFACKFGACDYAIVHDESTDVFADCGLPQPGGGFEWRQAFDEDSEGETTWPLVIRGYERAGTRDFMPINGRLSEAGSEFNPPDRLVAVTPVAVRCYQAEFRFEVAPGRHPIDWDLTRLLIHPETKREIGLRQAARDERGFVVDGPDSTGRWIVTYHPTANEVNHKGTTEAALLVADEKAERRTLRVVVPTP